MPKKIEISHRTILFTFFTLGAIWFLFLIKDVIMQLIVAFLIMIVLNPSVTRLHKKFSIPRIASVLIVYLLAISLVIFVVIGIIPPLVDQSTAFANNLPEYLVKYNIPPYVVSQLTNQFSDIIGEIPTQLLRAAVSIVSNLISVLTVLFIALYLLLAREDLDKYLSSFLNKKDAERIDKVIAKLEKNLGGWARAQVVLMFVVGTTTYVGLVILGVPYAVPLALLAGLFEIIPNLGPFIAAIPSILVGFGVSPLIGFSVLALTFLIQQVENYLLVPKIMQRSADVTPIVTLVSLLIGFRVAGVVGAVLSVPTFIALRVIFNEYYHSSKK